MPTLSEQFQETMNDTVMRKLEELDDVVSFYTMAFDRLATNPKLHVAIRSYARRTIIGSRMLTRDPS